MMAKRRHQEKSELGLKRCTFMLPRDLHQSLRREAFDKESSMSKVLVEMLRRRYRVIGKRN